MKARAARSSLFFCVGLWYNSGRDCTRKKGKMRMKEKLYTIELTDAVKADDECMFCWLERKLEQENLEFVLGSSYMESDIREQTSQKGFCCHHTKMMYDYGNTLGNAWILKSRLEHMNREFQKQMGQYQHGMRKSGGLAGWFRKPGRGIGGTGNGRGSFGGTDSGFCGSGAEQWLRAEEHHCYICDRMQTIYGRMLDTFVYQLRNDSDFCGNMLQSKGFCMHHFADVLHVCEEKLKPDEKETWIPKISGLMSRNLDRIQQDIDWLIEKFDYRNQDADWKNSKDAVQRTMQKLVGSYPADPVFQNRK